MRDHGYARGLAVWARNPCGFTWEQVKPIYIPRSLDDIREWAYQDCRDAGIQGDTLDDAIDRIDSVLHSLS
jgi:hypothetical protein